LKLLWMAMAMALAAGSSALCAAPFSHRLHLQMNLACAQCHTAAAHSTRVEDNLLPAKEVCLNCHQQTEAEIQIPPPPVTRITSFSHAQHLKMGNVAPLLALAIDKKNYLQPADDIRRHLNTRDPCEACHRGLEESDRATHAALPQMADCLVCHSQIENPFSCEACHGKNITPLKPASHTANFMDTHSAGKLHLDKAQCAVCHGRTFTCMGCH
jgi:hypothetical protein